MTHEIIDNNYYVYDKDGTLLLSVKLCNDFEGDQIVIQTEKEVYAGPVNLLSFSENR